MATAQAATREEMKARATALVPELRERAAEADKLRRVPDANVEALRAAGLYNTILPKNLGGSELDLHAHIDTISEVARGCGSTGWCLGVAQAHTWLISQFPEPAQTDVYGAKPDAIIAAVLTATRGSAEPAEGGWKLTGVWPFSSHCEHADWLFLGAVVKDKVGDVVDEAVFLVPRGQIKIRDDWNVSGLRGTGSCTVECTDIMVPAHRHLSLPTLMDDAAPGRAVNKGWLYQGAAAPVLVMAVAIPAVGIARATIETFLQRTPGRPVAYTFGYQQEQMQFTQMLVAEAAAKTDAAELVLRRLADDIERYARAGERMPQINRGRARMDCAFVARLCCEAVETLAVASGASAIATSSPIARAANDVRAISTHGLLLYEVNKELYGRVLFGLEPSSPIL